MKKKQNHMTTGLDRQHLTNIRLREMVIKKQPMETYSYQAIADFCSLTKERVRQIENQALKKLRQQENTQLWKELSY
jgi:DNA-directed RNA polymerase sigma subunit (sigma70/sigma32)